jgi:hypothetical protein
VDIKEIAKVALEVQPVAGCGISPCGTFGNKIG